MPRLLFEKKGNAVWISHLDLMRLFQRAFKRAGLPLTHTKGFNPRPSVSIALPLSVGIESSCELLDFDLDGEDVPCDELAEKLNGALVDGVRVLEVYGNGSKTGNLSYLDCTLCMEYDRGVPEDAESALTALFEREDVTVTKKNKNGTLEQNIIPMIRWIRFERDGENRLMVTARVCCQNPTLNPMLIPAAIEKYLPELSADFVSCCRDEIYDKNEAIFR